MPGLHQLKSMGALQLTLMVAYVLSLWKWRGWYTQNHKESFLFHHTLFCLQMHKQNTMWFVLELNNSVFGSNPEPHRCDRWCFASQKIMDCSFSVCLTKGDKVGNPAKLLKGFWKWLFWFWSYIFPMVWVMEEVDEAVFFLIVLFFPFFNVINFDKVPGNVHSICR